MESRIGMISLERMFIMDLHEIDIRSLTIAYIIDKGIIKHTADFLERKRVNGLQVTAVIPRRCLELGAIGGCWHSESFYLTAHAVDRRNHT